MRLKNAGIFLLLLVIVVVATSINGSFADPANVRTLVRDTSLYGLISIGVAFVIITGGIDLSIGSLIALSGVLLVQVIDVDYRATGFRTVIAETRPQVTEPFQWPALRLQDPLPDVNEGDRLTYQGFAGQQSVTVAGTRQVGDQTWVEIRGPLQLLRAGIPVGLTQITHRNPWLACLIVLLVAAAIGLLHGVLVTWGNLQPFVVTLCGLLIYRGIARVRTHDDQVGLLSAVPDFKAALTGTAFPIPLPLIGRISGRTDAWYQLTWIDFPVTGVLLVVVATLAWLFLNRTVYGRHLLALGQNEQAARYSGVATRRLTILAYVVCSSLAGLAGILFTLDWNSVQPGVSGTFYELYAIAAAVLGGCSLRGGQGALVGVIAGAAVMRCLYKAIAVLGIRQEWEMVIIGLALLAGVVFDEAFRRFHARRRLTAAATFIPGGK